MSRGNPYAFDPNLMQGFSNLTRALIGSASDDAALARAKASEAAARASDARAGLYGSQRTGQELRNDYLTANNAAIENALADSALLNSLFGTFGLDSGNLPTNPTGRPGPFIGNNPDTSLAPGVSEDAMRGLVRSMFFGGVPGNPQQSAASAQTIANMANDQAAYDLLAQSGQSPDRQAAIRLGMNPGQYFDQGFAQLELETNDATNRADDRLDYNADLNEDRLRFGEGGQGDRDTTANNAQSNKNNQRDNETRRREIDQRYGQGGQGDRDTAAQERWERYKADKTYDAKVYDTDKDDSLARWQHNNRDIEISVEPGKQIVLNPAAAKILGVPQQDNGLYILDGGPKPGAIIVKVGEEDVYLTEDDAKRLGIKKNDAGQFVIPGKPKPRSNSGSGSGSGADVGSGNVLNMTRYQEQFKKDVTAYIDPNVPLPGHAIGAMLTISEKMIRDDLKDDAEMNVNTAYSRNVIPMLSAGGYNIGGGYIADGFNVPRYFIDYFARMPQNAFNNAIAAGQNGAPSQFVDLWTRQMRYSQDELEAIFEEVQRLRR